MLRESLCRHKVQKKRATRVARFKKPCAQNRTRTYTPCGTRT